MEFQECTTHHLQITNNQKEVLRYGGLTQRTTHNSPITKNIMGLIRPPKMVVPAEADYLPALRQFISNIGEKYKLTKHEINAFKISIDEAATNIIKHGYQDGVGSITMKVFVSNDRLIVELIDQGQSFDPNIVDNPNITSFVEKAKKGGLGIFMMRKFLDVIEYEVTNIGNVLRLIKLRENKVTRSLFVPITSVFRRIKEKLLFSVAN